MKMTFVRLAALLASAPALAHEGHGAPSASHWHATDTVGLLLALGLAGVALWFLRRK